MQGSEFLKKNQFCENKGWNERWGWTDNRSQFCENKGWNERWGWIQITNEKTKKGQSRWKVRMKIITGKKTGVQTSFLI